MREMKDSEIDILGMIPKSWKLVRFKFLCDIMTGNHDTQDADIEGVYPFYVRSPIVERCNDYTFDGEGILMAGDGAGAGKVFHHAYKKYAIHQRVYCFHNFKSINSNFLYYFISNIFCDEMDKGSAQTTVPSIRLSMIQNFNVCVPTVKEQNLIVDYLDKKCEEIDSLLSNIQKQIEILEKYKKTVITEAVTKGLNPNVEMRDSGISYVGNIPATWKVHPLYYYFGERKNKNNLGKEENLLSLSYGKIIRKDITLNGGLLPESFTTYNIVEKDDIIIRPTDLQNDKRSLRTGLVKEHGIITSAYITLKRIKQINVEYVHYLLHAFDVMKVFYNMGNGVRQGLNYSEFSRLQIFEPSIMEQDKIVSYLNKKCAEIDSVLKDKQEQLKKLAEYKKSLIYEYVTGKKEVI